MNLSEANFENISNNFTNVIFKVTDGYLKINKRNITLTSASANKVYDGTPLTNDTITVSGDGFAIGEGAIYTFTKTITNVGKVDNEFTYALNKGTLVGNYEITTNTGILKVTPVTEKVVVKVKGNSASGDKYDGNEKSVTGYEVISIINDNGLYSSGDVDYSGILAHEEAHIRHRDHLLKPAAFLLLTVYWFHALIWLAFILFCRDLEFACDERVIRMLPEQERADYSQSRLKWMESRSRDSF